MKLFKTLLISSLGLLSSLQAIEYTSIGAKSTGMGGTGVSNANPSLSGYYNPALLGLAKNGADFSIGFGNTARDKGVGESVKNLQDAGFLEIYEKLNANPLSATPQDIQTLVDGKQVILDMNNDGVILNPDAHVAAQFGQFGFGIFVHTEGSGAAKVDQSRQRIIVGSDATGYYDMERNTPIPVPVSKAEYINESMIYALEAGTTYLNVKGIALAEVPLSYTHNFNTAFGQISVGGSLKYMHAIIYSDEVNLASKNIFEEIKETQTQSSNFGIDAGVAFVPKDLEDLRLGLVSKNINSPEFKTSTSYKYRILPMLRLGASYDIIDSLEVAFDYDLTTNKTEVSGLDIQYVGLGLDFHPIEYFNISVGLIDNVASELEGHMYSAGIGVGPEWLELELAGQYSSTQQTVENITYPSYSKVSLSIVSTW